MSLASNKPIVLGVAAGVVVVVIAGYLYAAGKGVEEFEDFLYDNDISDAIRYRDVSYSPLSDTVTMQDVDLDIVVVDAGRQQKKLTGNLESLSLEGASDDDKRRIAFSGYELVTDPGDAERRENIIYDVLAEPLKTIRRMAIEETRLDGSIAYDYDKDDEHLMLALALDAGNIASYSMDVTFERARKLVDTKLSDFMLAALFDPKRQLQEFGRVEFVSLNANLEDYGFIERMMYLDTISGFSYANAVNNDTDFDAVKATRQGENAGRDMAEFLDEDSIEALTAFQTQGGDLEVSIATERPVRLSDLVKNDKLHRDIKVRIDR